MLSPMTLLTKTDLKDSVNKITKVRKNGGFQIKYIDADMQFECTPDEIEEVEIDMLDADDHSTEVEMVVQTVKYYYI